MKLTKQHVDDINRSLEQIADAQLALFQMIRENPPTHATAIHAGLRNISDARRQIEALIPPFTPGE